MKKKKEEKIERKSKFNNFQITWNDCNSEGEVEEKEESAHMAFMAIGVDEITTCNSQFDSDDESDDDINSFMERLCGEDDDAGVQEEQKKLTINDQDITSPEDDSKEDDSQVSPALEDNDRNRRSVSAGHTTRFKLRDEDIEIVEPSTTKSPKRGTEKHGEKGKGSVQKKHSEEWQTAEQTEEQPTALPPVSDSEKELEQPINADASVTKSPRKMMESHSKKGKRSAKSKGTAQTKERQTADPSTEQNAENQQAPESSTRKSPRTRSGGQTDEPAAQRSAKKKRVAREQPEAQTAKEPTFYPSSLMMMSGRGSNGSRRKVSSLRGLSSLTNSRTSNNTSYFLENGLMMTISPDQQVTFIDKRNLLVPPIPQDNENVHQKEPRTELTEQTLRTETTPEARASSSQPQDKGKAPITKEETEEDDEETEEEEVDPVQYCLARRRLG
ncbi:DNA ligase 1-like [Coffea eugenioides]|uniref:DNA ligase 1-like n=1 Tax=Coffea eugenioides TaxID=49369 RepID=UPI000F60B438|nr:DNA ligase 1-like [Coffea eugenioides]